MSIIDQHTLSNGVKIAMIPLRGLRSVTIEVFVRVGSKYEKKEEHGMSHFLEHMAFKGTAKRLTALELNKEIDAKGASHNAGTGHEWTSYYIKTIEKNIPWAIDVLSDILLNSTYPEKELAKEQRVVIEEINMYDDNPTMGLAFTFMERYLKSNVGCWSITGSENDIKDINRNKMMSFKRKMFDPARMVVVVAGDISGKSEFDNVLTLLEKHFGQWRGEAEVLPKIEVVFEKDRNIILKKDIEQAHFCLGWPGVSWEDERRYVAKLVEIIMLGNSSSKLWNAIREDRGLAYYLFPISEHFEEMGIMGLQAGVTRTRLEEAIEVTKKELFDATLTITEADLIRAKDYIIGKMTLSMDQSDFWTDFIGQRILLNQRVIGVKDLIKQYSKVKLNDLFDYTRTYIISSSIRLLTLTK